jgi:SNF2 family DNA or RNA helicase
MTGTPVGNSPADLWTLLYTVEPEQFPDRVKYIDRYCQVDPYGPIRHNNIERLAELHTIIAPYMRRMLKAVVLPQLPPKIFLPRYVEMTPKQAKAYADMKTMMAARIEDVSGDSFLTASMQITQRLRLLQLATSNVKVEVSTDAEGLPKIDVELVDPSPKIDEFLNILDEMGDKPVAACSPSAQLIRLTAKRLDKLGIKYSLIIGGMEPFQRQYELDQFQSGNTRVMLFTEAAGGVGLTMTATDTLVYLSRSDSMTGNRQTMDRFHRPGAEIHEAIIIIDLIARATVEEKQVKTLLNKFAILDQLLKDRQQLIERGISTNELDEEISKLERLKLEPDSD